MALSSGMFLFEVVMSKLESFVESRNLIVKADFADVFSLELKDPKKLHIVIPEPLPLPPEPVGKKGKKKKKKPKPKKKKKKGKKGKKGAVELPPPEPEIMAGQSVLFSSSAEVLIQNMKKYPLELSLWSADDHLVFIGIHNMHWDPRFQLYLEKIFKCENPEPPVVKDSYNIFQEGSAKIMAKATVQVKLSYLTDRVVSSFRTLSEDPGVRKVLYTGMNSKTTSLMCTLKTTEDEYQSNWTKYRQTFIKDRPKPPLTDKPIVYADYKNAPPAYVPLPTISDEPYCCMSNADKPPNNKYKAPETCPDVDFIGDYVRKVILSCNDNMRMLTPRPTIRPRVRATDIDRLCYCRETSWPQGALAERFRRETQGGPCPVCIREIDGKPRPGLPGQHTKVFDLSNLRGPCGRPDCRIARDMRLYIEKLLDEDNKEFNINDIIGPCGSKSCTLVDKIKNFLRHEGPFSHGGKTLPGMPTQCACLNLMTDALRRTASCDDLCSIECSDSDNEPCGGPTCPFSSKPSKESKESEKPKSQESKAPTPTAATPPPATPPTTPPPPKKDEDDDDDTPKKYIIVSHVQQVYYFTVEYDNNPVTPQSSSPKSSKYSASNTVSTKSSKYKYCPSDCPMLDSEKDKCFSCSKSVCSSSILDARKAKSDTIKCINPKCPHDIKGKPLSPADSDIVLPFKEIRNPCCVKSCELAEKVKDFIVTGLEAKKKKKICTGDHDPCYCDCDCNFTLTAKTTYCAICGGYECLGDDIREQPEYRRPHPCPIYHKLYDKNLLKTQSPWTTEELDQKQADTDASSKKGKAKDLKSKASVKSMSDKTDQRKLPQEVPVPAKEEKKKEAKKVKESKKPAKVTKTSTAKLPERPKKFPKNKPAPTMCGVLVPKDQGWLWNAEDIPGLKYRPKWRPGATNKGLVRKYRTVREGVDIIAKKKRAMMQKRKKLEFKPHLVVTKKDGEYTVRMEVFKKYSKERLRHQYPYDETPPIIYTVGKTEETKRKLQRQKERRERRETRRKSRLLQSTFRDKCQEVCLKAYNQAIGLVPLTNPNYPECPCDIPMVKNPDAPIVDSCSCSEEGSISSSDTDGDDWIIEFTPPSAKWVAKAKHPPVLTDSETQYSYMDYRVKLNDKQGNPVPRLFKGPDGKQECSDLGGFWGPGHVWLEINKDGYIGTDGRWVPQNFVGPDGQNYSSDEGGFTDALGNVFKIGIDGYIENGKWVWYKKKQFASPRGSVTADDQKRTSQTKPVKTSSPTEKSEKTKAGKTQPQNAQPPPPEKTAAVPQGNKTPIQDAHSVKSRKIEKEVTKKPPPDEVPQQQKNPTKKKKNRDTEHPAVMNVAVERHHPPPVAKKKSWGMKHSESARMARYKEILPSKMYETVEDLRPLKTNRASNTQYFPTEDKYDVN